MLRPKSMKRAPARRPFLTEGAPRPSNLATYGARLSETIDPRVRDSAGRRTGMRDLPFGRERIAPPSWILDKIAEETISRGYSRKANPVCNDCGVMKSRNGGCFC